MRKVAEYRKAAADCRKRAATAQDENEKKALEHLAATWDSLAETRQTQIEKGLIEPLKGGPDIVASAMVVTDSLTRTT